MICFFSWIIDPSPDHMNVSTLFLNYVLSALNATVADILSQLTTLQSDADSVLAGINGILQRTYDSEMQTVNEELQNVQAASSLAMSAQYNVTSHRNTSLALNRTALGAEGSLMLSDEVFDEMKLRMNTVTNLTNQALVLINQTKVCSGGILHAKRLGMLVGKFEFKS